MNELEVKCVTAGLKMTEQRRVILQVLADAADHPSVDTVYARARARSIRRCRSRPSIGRSACSIS